jgi:hypothetical protein
MKGNKTRDTSCPVCGRNEWIRKVKKERVKSDKIIDLNILERPNEVEVVVYVCKYDGYEKRVD